MPIECMIAEGNFHMTEAPLTLGQAKQRARALLEEGDYPGALAITDRLLAAFPLDDELRCHVAEILARSGLTDEATALWRLLAHHFIQGGQPLRAVVAAHALGGMGRPEPEILAELARTYADGSPRLAPFASRPAPPDPGAPVPTSTPQPPLPYDQLAAGAHGKALDLSAHGPYHPQLHRIPFLSELAEEPLRAVLHAARVHRLDAGDQVLRQGEPGNSLFLVASGELRVFVQSAAGPPRELARVHQNSLVGEMALLTSQPRAATVAVIREASVIELTRDALETAAGQIPALRVSLDRFARERLIKNLLSTSPLFTAFTREQQADLLRRFEGIDVEPGTEIIREGDEGRGLYVVLVGQLEVSRRDPVSDTPVHLARLTTGEIFGEMSLIANQPTSATVRSLTRCTLLFLARVYVDRLSAAFPEVRAYFAEVSERRARDNNLTLGAAWPEEPIELDVNDILLL
jgi:CRP-like cAMP-binding protein